METNTLSTIPVTEKDITSEWIHKVTGMQPLNNTIKLTANIQDGVGFLSNLCRVSFNTESGQENILVKLLPSVPELRTLTISQRFDEREIKAYTIVLPEIIKIVPELEKNFCKYYCGNIEKSNDPNTHDHLSMLIIEDLKPNGYEMYNPECENWLEYVTQLLKFTAQFHFAGLAIENSKNKTLSQLFPFCLGVSEPAEPGNINISSYDGLLKVAHANFPKLITFLEDNQCNEIIQNSYKQLGNHVDEIFVNIIQHGAKFPTVLHGDIWPPNVMVTKDSAQPVKIIDWQILTYKDPTYELTVALLTCIPLKELSIENIDKFAKVYYEEFVNAGLNNLSDRQRRSWEDFYTFFNKWGMAYGFLWFLLSLESFPNDQNRLVKVFEMLHEKYQVTELLMSSFSNTL